MNRSERGTQEEMTTQNRAVFFDRDGVLCQAVVRDGRPCPTASLAETQLMPGARLVCEALKNAGFLLVMIGTQQETAHGSPEAVGEMNLWLATELGMDAVEMCPHQESDRCTCRTPAPGLLTEAAARLNIKLTDSFLVGDRWTDIEAGLRAGCRTAFIDYQYREPRPDSPSHTAESLLDAAEYILLAEPASTPNSAANFLMGLVARTRAVGEFHRPRVKQTRKAVELSPEVISVQVEQKNAGEVPASVL